MKYKVSLIALCVILSAPLSANAQSSREPKVSQGIYYMNNKQYDKALDIFWRLAGKSDPQAQYYLGIIKERGYGTTPDLYGAVRWIEKSALQDYMPAALYMGNAHYNGKGAKKDFKKAFMWYEKAAKAGYAEAQNQLGMMLKKGEGVDEPDLKKAMEMFVSASNQGYADATYNIGKMYEDGDLVAKNYKQALTLYQQAANSGSVPAMNAVGDAYYKGSGGYVSHQAAIRYYFAAATKGDKDAILSLARMMEKSEGDPTKGPVDAVDWYKKAADSGSGEAMFRLGKLYEEGREGIKQDHVKAFKYYSQAAEKDDYNAKMNLARCYEQGIGVTPGPSSARRIYEKLALYGDPDAMYEFARFLKEGIGGGNDLAESYVWYALAADLLTDEDKKAAAVVARIEVSNNLSDDELRSARTKKLEWKPLVKKEKKKP